MGPSVLIVIFILDDFFYGSERGLRNADRFYELFCVRELYNHSNMKCCNDNLLKEIAIYSHGDSEKTTPHFCINSHILN